MFQQLEDAMKINQFKSITQIQNEAKLQTLRNGKTQEISGFQQTLQEKMQQPELTFSKHALEQIKHRQIHLDEVGLKKLNEGVSNAREKGIKESLMLMDNVAYVVSIKNATVITALEAKETKNHVFTNIDGAVVL